MLQPPLQLASALVVVIGLASYTPVGVSAATHQPERRASISTVGATLPAQHFSQAIPKASTQLRREVFGFALASSLSDPTMGYTSWNFSLLSTVAFFGLHVNWDGTIVSDSGLSVWNSSTISGLLSTAHAAGTKVVLTIVLQDFQPGTPNMCAGLTNRATTVRQVAAQVVAKGVDGLNVDYEGLNGTCPNGQTSQSMLTDFARQLRGALPSGAYLSIDTYAGAAADSLGFFDVPGLSNYVDSFFVMAYDLEYSNYARAPLGCPSFCLGPTAPLTGYYYNDTSTAAQYAAVVPASKVILGVPYYGRKSCVSAASPNLMPTSSVVADDYLDASTESSAPAVGAGSFAAHRDANDASGQERWDTWYNTSLGCIRELYWDDPASLSAKYDLVNRDGLRGVGIWTLNYGGGAPELWSALAGHFLACSGVTVSTAPASPASVGRAVAITAHATGCPNPVYHFSVMAPGSSTYQLAQDYSSNPTFTWNTSGLASGGYRFSVWARDAGSAGVYGNAGGRWDAYDNGTVYTLLPVCTGLSVTASPASPAATGSAVAITGRATGCPNPVYHFNLLAPGASSYQLAQDYTSNATLTWSTSGLVPGSYRFSVWARDASSSGAQGNASGRWDVYDNSTVYTLTPSCSSVSVTVSPPSPASTGATVALTARASGCPNPVFHFNVLAPGAATYQLAQDYSSNATFNWQTSGLAPGSYRFSVWARDASSPGASGNSSGRWDAYDNSIVYALTPVCSGVTMTVQPASPAAGGTTVTATAHASGCPNPVYHFNLMAPGTSTYQTVQDYSSSATFTWNTAGLAPGSYRFSVWARDAASPGASGNASGRWDAYDNNTVYALTPVCSSVSVTVSPAGPSKAGTAVTVTAHASGCPNPVFHFSVMAPGTNTYQTVQDYSANGTFTWNTAGLAAGTYRFSVWARDASSPGAFGNTSGRWDAYDNNATYVLS